MGIFDYLMFSSSLPANRGLVVTAGAAALPPPPGELHPWAVPLWMDVGAGTSCAFPGYFGAMIEAEGGVF